VIYFDAASTSYYKPETVKHAVVEAMSKFGNGGRGGHSAAMAATRSIYSVRARLAPLFGARPNQIAFTYNATAALNMAIFGLLGNGGHAITTVLEHNSVLRPLYQLQRKGLSLDFVGFAPDGDLDYDAFGKLLKKETRCVIVTHCSNVTGQITNLDYLADFCNRHDLILIIDAAQSAGLFKINIARLGRSIVCFTGHKGLLGPQGTGGLVANDVEIAPMFIGGTGSDSFTQHHSEIFPESLEAGTLNSHGLAGLAAGAQHINEKGMEVMLNEGLALAKGFEDGVRDIEGVKILGNCKLQRAPIVCMNIGGLDSVEVEAALADRKICVRGGFHCAPLMHKALGTEIQGAVRFSFSSFNTELQVQFAMQAVREIVKELA